MAQPLSEWATRETATFQEVVNAALEDVGESHRRCPVHERAEIETPMKLLIRAGYVFADPKSARMAARYIVTSGESWFASPEFKPTDTLGPQVPPEQIMEKMQMTQPP